MGTCEARKPQKHSALSQNGNVLKDLPNKELMDIRQLWKDWTWYAYCLEENFVQQSVRCALCQRKFPTKQYTN